MANHRTAPVRPRHLLYGALVLTLGCTDEPTMPQDLAGPEFTKVTNLDPTRILTVGVDAPRNLTLKGTVAGIVVVVDNAIVDLSKATVDCSGQTGPDEPKIGVWLKNNRSNVHIKGGGTGVIKNCGTGVLIGSPYPKSGDPGGSSNHIDGLVMEDLQWSTWGCPSGPYEPNDVTCPVNIALSNSHDNKVDHNRISASEWGIAIVGADAGAAVSGGNKVSDNTVVYAQSWAIFVHSDRNTIRDNVTMIGTPESPTMGILVDGDRNLVSGNELSGYPTIRLAEGADDNTIKRNLVMGGYSGIVAEANTFRNVIRDNTALSTDGPGAIDRSGACVNNTWTKNTFTTADPSCILGTPVGANYWTTVAPMPTGRTFLGVGVVNGILYAVGGYAPGLYLSTVEAYDPSSDTWTTKAPMPTAKNGMAVGVVNGILYTIGGGPDYSAVYAYDPVANAWTSKAPMPTARSMLGAAVVNGIIYAVGGMDNQPSGLGTVEAYDPATDTWTTKAPMPTPRGYLGVAVVNGVVYAVGGDAAVGGSPVAILEAYDPATNSWTTRAPMPEPRSQVGVGVVGGILYVVGGNPPGTGWSVSNTVYAYDPSTNTWTTRAPMPTPRISVAVGVVSEILYAVGGNLLVIPPESDAVEAYHP